MFTHITIGTNNLPQATDFYNHVLATIGIQLAVVKRNPARAIYKRADSNARTSFCVYSPFNGEAASGGNGTMVSFEAQDRAQVDQFYETAMRCGGSDEGVPGLRTRYSPNFYGAYIRDLDGNKICCVCYREM